MTVGGTLRGAEGLAALAREFEEWEVLPSVIYPRNVEEFLDSPRRVCTLASVPLDRAQEVLDELAAHGRHAFVNVDTCPGFTRQDAVTLLAQMGAAGVQSTRLSTVQRARQAGLGALQVVFLTDRSAVLKGIAAVRSAEPDLVQVMPAPVLGHLRPEQRDALGPLIVSGFVDSPAAVDEARALGALGASSSTPELWRVPRAC